VRFAVLLVLACGGCDVVLRIDHLGPAPDAPPCGTPDEDCDGQVDAVDTCPADADMPNVDDDGDMVGDACDPDRGMPGNHLALFDGFDDNSRPWSITSGAWQLAGGAFTQPTIGDARVELAVAVKTPTVEAIIPQLDTVGNGFVTVFGSAGGSELTCSVVHDQATGVEHLQIHTILSGNNNQIELTGTGTLRIRGGQHQDGTFYCGARRGTNFDVVVTAGSLGPQLIDHIGLSTSSAAMTVSSITLYDVP
jgi:hypothetical protein